MSNVTCSKCGGKMQVRTSAYGAFLGCSNFPKCSNKLTGKDFTNWLSDSIYKYLELEGINIYSWYRECWKCHKQTRVMTYFLNFQILKYFPFLIPQFEQRHVPKFYSALDDLPPLDEYLLAKYSTIEDTYSKTRKKTLISNICEHCKALQGRNFVAENPIEVQDKFNYETNESEKLIIEKIKPVEARFDKDSFDIFMQHFLYDFNPQWIFKQL